MSKLCFYINKKFLFHRLHILISSFSIALLTGCIGCSSVPEPIFITNTPDCKKYNEADLKKYQRLSEESAKLGWSYLNSYFNKDNLIPAFNRSYIADAMTSFNYCWSFNNQNYQAYWGAGVVRGIQATFTDDQELTEKYMKQSVAFILLATKHKVPSEQINNLRIDLANAYNGLGAFYIKVSQKELANTNLEFARTTLLEVIKNEPNNGRAFYILAVTYFYQEKFKEAKLMAEQALAKNYKVPEDFLKDLSSKNFGTGIQATNQAQLLRDKGLSLHFQPKRISFFSGSGFTVDTPISNQIGEKKLKTPEELKTYYFSLSSEIQNNGIWIVITHPDAYSDTEKKLLESVKDMCLINKIPLFICRASALPNGWKRVDKTTNDLFDKCASSQG